jgi:hypothetical protein
MPHVHPFARLAILASIAFACSSQKELHQCPPGGARIDLPSDQQSMVTAVVGNHCFQAVADTNGGILLTSNVAGTCHVLIGLANGQVLASDVTFTQVDENCPYTFVETDGSAPAPTDASIESPPAAPTDAGDAEADGTPPLPPDGGDAGTDT